MNEKIIHGEMYVEFI